jgi:hypothetical protein
MPVINFANSLSFPGANVSYDVDETAHVEMDTFNRSITFANTIVANGSVGGSGQVLTSSGAGVYWSNGATANSSNTFGDYAGATSNTFTTSTTSQVSVDAFPTATFRTAKYYIQIVASNGDVHASELLATHNGSVVFNTEYGTVFSNVSLASITADINAGNFRLLVTPINSVNTIRVYRTTLTA